MTCANCVTKPKFSCQERLCDLEYCEPKIVLSYVKNNYFIAFHIFSCSKELGQWDLLMEFGKTKGHANPFLGKFTACL